MVIKEIQTANGCNIIIDDKYAAPKGSADELAIIEEQRNIAKKILDRYAERIENERKEAS